MKYTNLYFFLLPLFTMSCGENKQVAKSITEQAAKPITEQAVVVEPIPATKEEFALYSANIKEQKSTFALTERAQLASKRDEVLLKEAKKEHPSEVKCFFSMKGCIYKENIQQQWDDNTLLTFAGYFQDSGACTRQIKKSILRYCQIPAPVVPKQSLNLDYNFNFNFDFNFDNVVVFIGPILPPPVSEPTIPPISCPIATIQVGSQCVSMFTPRLGRPAPYVTSCTSPAFRSGNRCAVLQGNGIVYQPGVFNSAPVINAAACNPHRLFEYSINVLCPISAVDSAQDTITWRKGPANTCSFISITAPNSASTSYAATLSQGGNGSCTVSLEACDDQNLCATFTDNIIWESIRNSAGGGGGGGAPRLGGGSVGPASPTVAPPAVIPPTSTNTQPRTSTQITAAVVSSTSSTSDTISASNPVHSSCCATGRFDAAKRTCYQVCINNYTYDSDSGNCVAACGAGRRLQGTKCISTINNIQYPYPTAMYPATAYRYTPSNECLAIIAAPAANPAQATSPGYTYTVANGGCPTGQTLYRGNCVANCGPGQLRDSVSGFCSIPPMNSVNTTCPAGTSLFNGMCTTNCAPGIARDSRSGFCEIVNNSVNQICPSGQSFFNGGCAATCDNGQIRDAASGACVISISNSVNGTCSVGKSLFNGICVENCPAGRLRSAIGMCGNQSTVASCNNSTMEIVNNACLPRCPSSQTRLATGNCVPNATAQRMTVCPEQGWIDNGYCRYYSRAEYGTGDGSDVKSQNGNVLDARQGGSVAGSSGSGVNGGNLNSYDHTANSMNTAETYKTYSIFLNGPLGEGDEKLLESYRNTGHGVDLVGYKVGSVFRKLSSVTAPDSVMHYLNDTDEEPKIRMLNNKLQLEESNGKIVTLEEDSTGLIKSALDKLGVNSAGIKFYVYDDPDRNAYFTELENGGKIIVVHKGAIQSAINAGKQLADSKLIGLLAHEYSHYLDLSLYNAEQEAAKAETAKERNALHSKTLQAWLDAREQVAKANQADKPAAIAARNAAAAALTSAERTQLYKENARMLMVTRKEEARADLSAFKLMANAYLNGAKDLNPYAMSDTYREDGREFSATHPVVNYKVGDHPNSFSRAAAADAYFSQRGIPKDPKSYKQPAGPGIAEKLITILNK